MAIGDEADGHRYRCCLCRATRESAQRKIQANVLGGLAELVSTLWRHCDLCLRTGQRIREWYHDRDRVAADTVLFSSQSSLSSMLFTPRRKDVIGAWDMSWMTCSSNNTFLAILSPSVHARFDTTLPTSDVCAPLVSATMCEVFKVVTESSLCMSRSKAKSATSVESLSDTQRPPWPFSARGLCQWLVAVSQGICSRYVTVDERI
ncbi:hypothetical protein M409DRAFT_49676 [Zasmidium cellare ATCC 36951]|uniref:Uncharacterized protein n=1 Tax=Zasmidium cellare ATCC 36951 TaxID=1080233 RepID=A0A6A6D6A2_ZASCE|nr:uncharacterized protein M409DRAFT_49676 [Zasmidium cellare ATCC 36951]KAF2173196.1 hypothetical protein M409DRAFT_49676 [Zasmidium cellare ATCC 36951]